MKKRKAEKTQYTNLKLTMKIVFWGSTFIAAWLGAIAAVKANIPFGVAAILLGLVAVFADRYAGKLKEIDEGPRKLTASQMKRLSPLLSEVKLPINFNIEYEQNDLESGEYIDQLARFLSSKCGRSGIPPIVLAIGSMRTEIGIPTDLTIFVKDVGVPPEPAKKLLDAFIAAKVRVSMLNRKSLAPEDFVLSAGKKPIR